MHALTLMSVIAPVVSGVPQGSSGEVASGFQSLLAAQSGESAMVSETKAAPAETPATDEMRTGTEAATPVVAAFLIAPVPQSITVVPPGSGVVTEEPVFRSDSDQAAVANLEPDLDTALDGASTTSPQPASKGLISVTKEPQVFPAVAAAQPPQGPSTESLSTLTQTAAVVEAVETQTRAATAPTLTSAPSQILAPTPAPLRPLAERTSRPVEPNSAKIGDRARVMDPARPASATVPAAVLAVADQATRSAGFVAALAGEAASADQAEDPASERPLPVEGTTAQTQSASAPRETTVSQLSRVTVEATAQIAAQILRRLEGRSTRFEMALTPDELGRVDVKLDIDSEGRLNARLAFDNPAAATDLRGRVDELRRQLEDAGFHLADDAFEFAERDSDSSGFDRGDNERTGHSRAFTAASRLNAEIDVAQPPRWMALSLSPSGVDMKV